MRGFKQVGDHFSSAIATVVGTVLGNYYYHHATIEATFGAAGAPGDPPLGGCGTKAIAWLKRTSKDESIDGLRVLGRVLEDFMDTDIPRNLGFEEHEQFKERVRKLLIEHGFEYLRGGKVIRHGVAPSVRQLEEILRDRDLGGVNAEYERALASISIDPEAATTAACAILEALCKVYIEDEGLLLPQDQSFQRVWQVVSKHLGLDPRSLEDRDLQQVLSGMASITQGLGALRTHAGSAHGRGRNQYKLAPRHARFTVNAAHSLAVFIIETWQSRKTPAVSG
jgi:hypothetical protein